MLKTESVTNILPVQMEPSTAPAAPAASAAPADPNPRYSNHIILTTYPGQSGIEPVPLEWGAPDAKSRGPVVVSRSGNLVKRRNAIGAHGGSYSVYNALAIAAADFQFPPAACLGG
ncbi:hypothetical protein DTO012A8_9906 [Penicillium roqueforti]|nr:hypothetical protein DTO012A8_9906 [Penicillium roqueforti]